MTANALCTSFSRRWIRRDNLDGLGLGMSDLRALAALVPLDGGALSMASAFVCDLVLRAGASADTCIGADDAMRRLRLTTGLGLTGNFADEGTTLGAGAGGHGWLLAMDLVMRMSFGMLVGSTLGTGCTLGSGGVWGSLLLVSLVWSKLSAMRWMSLMSWSWSIFLMPLIALAQSANAIMILSCGVTLGLVIFLCWNCTVSLNLSLLVSLM